LKFTTYKYLIHVVSVNNVKKNRQTLSKKKSLKKNYYSGFLKVKKLLY